MTEPRDALRACFLGPRVENAELFEPLITEALRDHVFLGRNYQPDDGFAIREIDKRSGGDEDAVAGPGVSVIVKWFRRDRLRLRGVVGYLERRVKR